MSDQRSNRAAAMVKVAGSEDGPRPVFMLDHAFGETVFLKVREERVAGLITGYILRPGSTVYCVTWGNGQETNHFGFELAAEYEPDFAGE